VAYVEPPASHINMGCTWANLFVTCHYLLLNILYIKSHVDICMNIEHLLLGFMFLFIEPIIVSLVCESGSKTSAYLINL